jgi:hypothetical protein
MSHRSRMCALVIDCPANHVGSAVAFWSAALGRAVVQKSNPSSPFTSLVTPEGPTLEVILQALTSQESRLHFDIETDDVEAEVCRLESLGAHRRHHVEVPDVTSWWVMEAPSGHIFCVVSVYSQAWPAGAVEWHA